MAARSYDDTTSRADAFEGHARLPVASNEALLTPSRATITQSCANPAIGSLVAGQFVLVSGLSMLACDLLGGATHMLRGRDIAPFVASSQLLAWATGQEAPRTVIFTLVWFLDGTKVAKFSSDVGVLSLREAGIAPGEVLSNLFRSLSPHLRQEAELTLSEMIDASDLTKIPACDMHVGADGLIESIGSP